MDKAWLCFHAGMRCRFYSCSRALQGWGAVSLRTGPAPPRIAVKEGTADSVPTTAGLCPCTTTLLAGVAIAISQRRKLETLRG